MSSLDGRECWWYPYLGDGHVSRGPGVLGVWLQPHAFIGVTMVLVAFGCFLISSGVNLISGERCGRKTKN